MQGAWTCVFRGAGGRLCRILELRPEAACNCASRRLMFLGNSALLPWLSPSGLPYLTLTDATRTMAVAV